MTSLNILKNIISSGIKNVAGHTPPVRVPLPPDVENIKYMKHLTDDVLELTPSARYIGEEASAVKKVNFLEEVVSKESELIQKYKNITIDDILSQIKDTKIFPEDEANSIKEAINFVGDDTPEFKAMLDSLIKQKKNQFDLFSCDDTNVSDIIWTLMSVQEDAAAGRKSILNIVNSFAKDKTDLKDINTFIDNLVNPKNSFALDEIDALEPILVKLSKNINITDKDFLSCGHCVLKNDPQFSEFLIQDVTFLKAYNAIGLKLHNEDLRLMIKNYRQKITPEEESSLLLYKSESQKINTGQLKQQAQTIESYLNRQSLDEEINVFRGEDYGFVDSVKIGDQTLGDILRASEKFSETQLKELIATKLSDYQIIQNRFMSTSLDSNIVESGKFGSKIIWNLTLPPKTKAACIDMHLPQNALVGETEVLVQKNSQLFIKNLQFENNKWYIDAIVIQ